jgi:hypothetical protein
VFRMSRKHVRPAYFDIVEPALAVAPALVPAPVSAPLIERAPEPALDAL